MDYMVSALCMGIVFLYGSVGEIITEKSGHLNLGIPGIMCMGTAGGCFGVSVYVNSLTSVNSAEWIWLILIPILFAVLFAILGGAIYALLTVTLRANQNVVGLAITIFGSGFAQFFIDNFVDRMRFGKASKIIRNLFTVSDDAGWLEELLFSHGFLFYLAIIIAVAAAIVLKRARVGLNLRAVGENPATADAAGINVTAYKYAAILIGSAIAGLGGLYYVMDYNGGTFDNVSTIQCFGWLSVALVIFTMWKPNLSLIGSFVFGFLYILASKITGTSSLKIQEIIRMTPYVVTVLVLILTSIVGKKSSQPPESLGLNYFREER